MTPMHLVGALVAEVGDGDRRVGHLRAAQGRRAGAAHQVAQRRHEVVERQPVGVVDGGRHQTAAPQRDGHAEVDLVGRAGSRLVVPEAVERGDRRRRAADALSSSAAGSRRSRRAGGLVGGAQPRHRRGQVDGRGHVVVGDLPLGAGHQGRDRPPERTAVDAAAGGRRLGRSDRPGGWAARSTRRPSRAARTRARNVVERDARSAARRRASGDARTWAAAGRGTPAAGSRLPGRRSALRGGRGRPRAGRGRGGPRRCAAAVGGAAGRRRGRCGRAAGAAAARRRLGPPAVGPMRASGVPTGTSVPGFDEQLGRRRRPRTPRPRCRPCRCRPRRRCRRGARCRRVDDATRAPCPRPCRRRARASGSRP